MKLSDNNYIIIQLWMVFELKLTGQALMLYAFLYSFGQGSYGFEGSDSELKDFVSPLIPRTSFYRALSELSSRSLLRVNGNIIMAVVPETIRQSDQSQSGTTQSQSGTDLSQNGTESSQSGTVTFYNKDKKDKKGSAPQKSQFSDPNELAKRIEYRRLHGFR